jgi:hypothetical protein
MFDNIGIVDVAAIHRRTTNCLLLAPLRALCCLLCCWGERNENPGWSPNGYIFIRNLQQLYTVFVLLPLATGGISWNYSSLSVVCPYGTLSIRRLISAIEVVYYYRTDRDKSQVASPSSILPSREKWLVVTISQPRHSRLKVTFFSMSATFRWWNSYLYAGFYYWLPFFSLLNSWDCYNILNIRIIFCPTLLGRLHQVEYAIEAINNAGTCVGMSTSNASFGILNYSIWSCFMR